MPTSRRPERLVVDANPILGALLGGMARRIFFEANIHNFAVPEVTVAEVRAYLPWGAQKIGVDRAILEYALDLLPLETYPAHTYHQSVREAKRRIGERDPKDVDVLALTLHLGLPLWSNDRDFEGMGIEHLTTARLLAMFFGASSR